ncbi:MAG: carbohydrate kinase family protein [Phycisphaerae bacterium]|nr:carbohydrate kinase family protein [Phycisphaerae bacterium]
MPIPPQVIVAGCVCLDVIPGWPAGAAVADILPGKLIEMGPVSVATGGAVSNTGLALHRLGVPVQLVGKVGDDPFGRMILEAFERQGPGLADGMVVAPGEATSYSVVINPPGVDRSFLHCPGANHTFVADDVPYDRVADPAMRLFHFGYPPIMRRTFANDGEQLERMFARVGEFGVTTSLDMCGFDPASPAGQVDWPRLLARVLPAVDLFLPSLDETLQMFHPGGAETGDMNVIRSLADRLLAMGAAVVGFKLGDQGLYVRTTADANRLAAAGKAFVGVKLDAWLNRELAAPCFEVEVAGTTGAGDCTIAGFLAGLLAGLSPEETATAATAVGACSVEQPDATSGVPHWSAVRKRVESGWRRRAGISHGGMQC